MDEIRGQHRKQFLWMSRAQGHESGTKEWNYPYGFDKAAAVEHDVAVVSAQAAWSDPGRLAD